MRWTERLAPQLENIKIWDEIPIYEFWDAEIENYFNVNKDNGAKFKARSSSLHLRLGFRFSLNQRIIVCIGLYIGYIRKCLVHHSF